MFLELPPGDVCPREKTSEEPSGDESPRGGIYVTGKKGPSDDQRNEVSKEPILF